MTDSTAAPGVAGGAGPVDILVVCTANRARSPAAAHLLAEEARRRKADGAVRLRSAGLNVGEWQGMLTSMAKAMRARGHQVEGHLSRRVDQAQLEASRLVVTMTEDQRRDVCRLDPSAVPRCFTLRELARLSSSPEWRPEWAAAWGGDVDVVTRLHGIRPLVPPADEQEDIADPREGGRRLARSVLADIASAVEEIATPLFGPVAS
jgi:protein-tyrosine phosphatase